MIDRITKNEERLDKLLSNIKELEVALENLKASKKDLDLLNKYYDSKNWIKDKDAYENGSIPKIKAGVLSEDAIWNMNEELKDIIKDMKNIVKLFYR